MNEEPEVETGISGLAVADEPDVAAIGCCGYPDKAVSLICLICNSFAYQRLINRLNLPIRIAKSNFLNYFYFLFVIC